MRRRLPPPAAAGLLLAALLLSCASDDAGPPALVAMDDPGAAARQAVLDRIGAGGGARTTVTPSILGRTPAAAQALLEGLGLDLHVVPFDRRRPVTVQWPPAGQPVPLDGVVEGWLGHPPEEVVDAGPATTGPAAAAAEAPAAPPTSEPDPAAAATAAPVEQDEQDGAAVTGGQDVAVSYILPPHTAGLLRTNPRRLPALPLGTELTGTASWYGPGFHGLRTACGGTYDQNGATIAARELRCGTVVRITGPTGQTVEATVTDWGPAEWTGRRFDLSAAVFNAIAPLGAGVVPVRVVTANVPG